MRASLLAATSPIINYKGKYPGQVKETKDEDAEHFDEVITFGDSDPPEARSAKADTTSHNSDSGAQEEVDSEFSEFKDF